MSTHPPNTFQQERQKGSSSAQAALAAVVALFILLLWLHFILAQEIESIGRQIGTQTAELERLERRNQALIGEITLVESQLNMAEQATRQGFLPQQPLYLGVSRPLVQPAGEAGPGTYLSLWSLGQAAGAGAPGEPTPGPQQTSVANLP